jgi:ATP-dependent helicase HrpA
VRSLEDRLRRQVILIDDNALYDFYDERLPHDITSSRDFDRWWTKEKGRKSDLLTLTREHLVKGQDDHVPLDDFPTEWQQDDLIFGLSYVFDPGAANDGVTVHIPLAVLNQVEPVGFEWLVPGLRLELMTSLLKALPKTLRRELVPLSDFAQAATIEVAEDGPLLPALGAYLSVKAGVAITARDFQMSAMADHSRITFAVHEADGAIVDFDKDLNKLKARLRKRTRAAIAEATPVAERTGLTDWHGGNLEKVVDATTSGGDVRGYPSLVAEAEGVAIRVLTTPEAQQRAMVGGTRRLLELTLKSPTKIADRAYTNDVKLALASFGWGTTNKLTDECVRGAIEVLLTKHGGPVWNEEGFRRLQTAVQADLDPVTVKAAMTAGQIMVAAVAASSRIDALVGPGVQDAQGDARSQLARLIRPGFVSRAGTERLVDVLRYVRAIEHRAAKIQSEPEKDRVKMRTVHRLEEAFDRLLDAIKDPDRRSQLAEVGWMIEEFRVSLFAQSLGTAYTISEKRIITELQRVASGG